MSRRHPAAARGVLLTTALAACAGASPAAAGSNAVARLLADYGRVRTLNCEVQRTVETRAGRIKFLSRVFYQRPDRIHVQNMAPLPRRILADGRALYIHAEGADKGFSRPISELDEDMLLSVRKLPGTAMDHLLRLRGVPAGSLPATEHSPVREGYKTKKQFVVLSLDAEDRLQRIDFYRGTNMAARTASYVYDRFREPLPGVWIPCRHRAMLAAPAQTRETVLVTNLAVNEPLAVSLFNPEAFFAGVEFADGFEGDKP